MILKLKRTPGIYLVGFMASGKTTVGKMLAEELGWHFVDIDDDIEAKAGCPISEIFETAGEGEFRKHEHAAIAERVHTIESGYPTVVALGGGAFAQADNARLLASNGISIWLDCSLEILKERVAKETNRPLAKDPEKFAALYESRRPSYERADFRVEVLGDDPGPVLKAILGLPIF
jgi:shikimate kinase